MVKKKKSAKKSASGRERRLANIKPHEFKKGVSGNPSGKPKGQRSYATIYKEALRKIGETQDMTPEEVEDILHRSGIAKAMKGDYSFYRDVLDRLHGKPTSPVDATITHKFLTQLYDEAEEGGH